MGELFWGKWIKVFLFKKKSFWEVKFFFQVGFWMWKKILKLRVEVRFFFKMEVGNGRSIFFWFDMWFDKGILYNLLGDRGIISMGIRREVIIEEVVFIGVRRKRKYRFEVFNDIEIEMSIVKEKLNYIVKDVNYWRWRRGYEVKFSI